jgi:hypothetical protein
VKILCEGGYYSLDFLRQVVYYVKLNYQSQISIRFANSIKNPARVRFNMYFKITRKDDFIYIDKFMQVDTKILQRKYLHDFFHTYVRVNQYWLEKVSILHEILSFILLRITSQL